MQEKRAAALSRMAKPRERIQREGIVLGRDAVPDVARAARIKRVFATRGSVTLLGPFSWFAVNVTITFCARSHHSRSPK